MGRTIHTDPATGKKTSSAKVTPMAPMFKLTAAQDRALSVCASNARHVLLYGGSRSGKTFFILLCMIIRAVRAPGTRHVVFRHRFNSCKRTIWYDTLPAVLKTCFPGMLYEENKSDWYIRLHNGSEIWIGGLDEKDRVEKILGSEYATAFFNECSEIAHSSVVTALTRLAQRSPNLGLNKAFYDCNPPSTSHWTYSLFVKKQVPGMTDVVVPNPDHYVMCKLNPVDNRDNIADGYIENILANLPERQRRRFLDGEWLEDLEGALWTRDMISYARAPVPARGMMKRVVVSIDPAVTSAENSAETGIMVEAELMDGTFALLEDLSQRSSPGVWGKDAVDAYHRWQADCIVGEVNNGGDLVEANLRNVDRNIRYKSVHASRGKIKRAEPVAGLYEQKKVKHCGEFAELEDQMCSYTGAESETSPDRLDAHVWGISFLTAKEKAQVGLW